MGRFPWFVAMVLGMVSACDGTTPFPRNPAGGGGGMGGGGGGGGGGGDGGLPSGVIAVPLGSLEAFAYTAGLALGDQAFDVLVDTGSTTVAVAGSGCSCGGVSPEYASGTTGTDQHGSASSTFGDNSSWSGEIFADTSSVLGAPSVPLDFVSITSETGFFNGNSFQGILGLGPDDLLSTGTTSFADAIGKAGVDEVLGFQLCLDEGTLWLGGYDSSATTAAPAYTPMNARTETEPWYTVDVASLGLGDGTLANESSLGESLVDTGTSITLVPPSVETAIVNAVNASSGLHDLFGSQTVSDGGCVTTTGVTSDQVDATLPPLTISFTGTSTFSLTPTKSYMFPMGGGEFCFVFSSSGSVTMSVLGDTLLTSFVTLFDVANSRIGFAPQTGCIEGDVAAPPVAPVPRTFGPGHPWWTGDPNVRIPHRSR